MNSGSTGALKTNWKMMLTFWHATGPFGSCIIQKIQVILPCWWIGQRNMRTNQWDKTHSQHKQCYREMLDIVWLVHVLKCCVLVLFVVVCLNFGLICSFLNGNLYAILSILFVLLICMHKYIGVFERPICLTIEIFSLSSSLTTFLHSLQLQSGKNKQNIEWV